LVHTPKRNLYQPAKPGIPFIAGERGIAERVCCGGVLSSPGPRFVYIFLVSLKKSEVGGAAMAHRVPWLVSNNVYNVHVCECKHLEKFENMR